MYLRYFGFKEAPFSITPDPAFLFFSESHRTALNQLKYGLNEGVGFMVLIGEVGTGKTTLSRKLMEEMRNDRRQYFEFAQILNPRQNETQLLFSILHDLGQVPASRDQGELQAQLQEYLEGRAAVGKRVVLLVDEAQNLDFEGLEQIRLLSNFETDKRKLLQIILLGQPELRKRLRRPELRQVRQRVAISCQLQALQREETLRYIRHRLQIAEAQRPPHFKSLALRLVYWRSRGVPRVINHLCERCLMASFAKSESTIGLSEALRATFEVGRI